MLSTRSLTAFFRYPLTTPASRIAPVSSEISSERGYVFRPEAKARRTETVLYSKRFSEFRSFFRSKSREKVKISAMAFQIGRNFRSHCRNGQR